MLRLSKKGQLNNKGAALVMVIVAMLFVGIIVSTVVVIVNNNLSSMTTSRDETETFYSAEAVMDEACMKLAEYADKAARVAYTDWLQNYINLDMEDQEVYFNRSFIRALKESLRDDFIIPLKTPYAESQRTEHYAQFLYKTNTPSAELDLLGGYDPAGGVTFDWDNFIVEDEAGGTITLKGVKATFTDDQGNASVITTDLTFKADYPGLSSADNSDHRTEGTTLTAEDLLCTEYIVITDGKIYLNAAVETSGKAEEILGGNIYAKKGIRAEAGTDAIISADKIITGRPTASEEEVLESFHINIDAEEYQKKYGYDDLTLMDNARLKLRGFMEGYSHNAELYGQLWTRNIKMLVSQPGADSRSVLVMRGQCYVADDLTMESRNSSFSFEGAKSEYVGYSTYKDDGMIDSYYKATYNTDRRIWTGTADGSSAIIVNGSNCSLDLTAASKVWVAGKAFVTVPDIYGGYTSPKNNQAYLEGESISYKGQQAAYLMPGDCLVGVGHNPMTQAEYLRLKDHEDNCPLADHSLCPNRIDLAQSPTNGDLRIQDFVDDNLPYRVATVRYTGDTGSMYYLYLNFQDADKAAEYFSNYFALMHKMVETRMAGFTGNIKVNPASLYTTGNVITYDSSTKDLELIDNNYAFVSTDIINEEYVRNNQYSGLLNALSETYMGLGNSKGLVNALVDWKSIRTIPSGELLLKDKDGQVISRRVIHNGLAGEACEVKLFVGTPRMGDRSEWLDIDGNEVTSVDQAARDVKLTAADGEQVGVILADGDVILDNAMFHGMIIARGNVIIKGSTHAILDHELINDIILSGTKVTESINLETFFATATEAFNTVVRHDATGLETNNIKIKYENWRKN